MSPHSIYNKVEYPPFKPQRSLRKQITNALLAMADHLPAASYDAGVSWHTPHSLLGRIEDAGKVWDYELLDALHRLYHRAELYQIVSDTHGASNAWHKPFCTLRKLDPRYEPVEDLIARKGK